MVFQVGHKINLGRKFTKEQRKKRKKVKVTWGKKISISKMGHGWPEGYFQRQSKAQKKRFRLNKQWNDGRKYGKSRWFWEDKSNQYRALHKRIQRKFGTPRKCQLCLRTDLKRYHWANRTGKYLEDINDWIRLCPSCHIKFDKSTTDLKYERQIA